MSSVCARSGAPVARTRAPQIQPAAPRKRGGHGERPKISLVARWSGAQTTNSANNPVTRTPMSGREGLTVAIEGDAVKLHAMIDEAEAELLGDSLLQRLQFVIGELDDVAGLD